MNTQRQNIGAYFLAGDPWWLENSVLSYYDRVERIVVSYDRRHLSWVGEPLPGIDECIDRVKAIDVQNKCEFIAGDYSHPGRHPLESDTYQRQCAVDQASLNMDWVLALDSDEVLQDPQEFFNCIDEADARGATGVDYPARWLYQRAGSNRFLERSSRMWRVTAGYPGPVAIRARTMLWHCRQAHADLYRVDFSSHNTDPAHSADAIVHRVIRPDQGILHFSWVRSDDYMNRKARISGHTDEYSQPRRLRKWSWRGRHPLLAVMSTPFRGRDDRFRWAVLPDGQAKWVGEAGLDRDHPNEG